MTLPFAHSQPAAADRPRQGLEPADSGSFTMPSGVQFVRRWGTAAALLLAPLSLVVQELLSPIDHEIDTGSEMLATLGDKLGRYEASTLLLLAGMALMLPTPLAVARLIRGRGGWFGLIGGWATAFGVLMFCVNIGAMGLALTAIADLPPEQRAAQAPAVDAILEVKGAVGVPATAIVGLFLGPILLAVGLWRSRAAPVWVALLLPIGWWLFLVAPDHLVRALGPALLAVAGGALALRRREPSGGSLTGGDD
jgi:hypothetical protein